MKTKIEVLGYEIEIEEIDGVVTVKADFDGETVEEFTLEAQESQNDNDDNEDNEDNDDVRGFGDFENQNEEEDFDGDFNDNDNDNEDNDDESDDESDDEDDDNNDNDEVKLESFSSFIKK